VVSPHGAARVAADTPTYAARRAATTTGGAAAAAAAQPCSKERGANPGRTPPAVHAPSAAACGDGQGPASSSCPTVDVSGLAKAGFAEEAGAIDAETVAQDQILDQISRGLHQIRRGALVMKVRFLHA
jgi:hypothetical protein